MCKSSNPRVIDPCLRMAMVMLKGQNVKVLASCCGHGIYPMSIVIEVKGFPVELFSGRRIPRVTRFYRRDAQGVFYIPETVDSATREWISRGFR